MRAIVIAIFACAIAPAAAAQNEAKRILAELKESRASSEVVRGEMVKAIDAKDYATGCEKSKILNANLARFRDLSDQQRSLLYERSNVAQRAGLDAVAASNKTEGEDFLRVSKQICDRAAQ